MGKETGENSTPPLGGRPGADPPFVIRLMAPNRSPMTLSGTNTYLFGEGEVVVIDPGPHIEKHLQAILDTASQLGNIKMILLTHHHADHAGGAAWLKEKSRAPLAAHENSPVRPDIRLREGERLRFGPILLRVFFTPGHASDHVCFLNEEENGICTGDLVLGEGSTSLNPPDGNLADYIGSLLRIKRIGASMLWPGHGPIGHADTRIDEMIRHRAARHREILRYVEKGIRDPARIVREIYANLDSALFSVALGNVQAHLEAIQQGFTFPG